MVWWSMLSLVLALVAALIGFAGVNFGLAILAEAMFLVFLCLFLASIVLYFWPRHA